MHELPIIEQVLNLALAATPKGERIRTINLRAGALCDAEPEWLERYLRIAAVGGPAEAARLVIVREEPKLYCPACGRDSIMLLPLKESLSCGVCGYTHVTLVSGLDCQLESIELEPGTGPEP